ncbi:MAG: IS630 family transposase [Nitrosospira sp.]|nr:IS630 family transposase [Nitrosospira sp.]
MLDYASGVTISAIARALDTNRPKIERCIDKALQLGALAALSDMPRKGRPVKIDDDARAWIVSLACQKPKELGYPEELWTTRLLAAHVRAHCEAAGHPSLAKLARGTVSKILSAQNIRPHKINYYLERRDPDFEPKMAQVLMVYKQVEVLRTQDEDTSAPLTAFVSFDEKPGIQAIERTAPDLPPVPGRHATVGRDYEYKRHGTLTLMAGLDLLDGHIHSALVDRHRSREFVSFLRQLDAYYDKNIRIRVVLDNHSAHISKETRAYLATIPNRFEFIFTPKHGSWLNLVESFFGKMARTLLRGIRVSSKAELAERIQRYIDRINEDPVAYRWKYKMEDTTVA